MYTGIYKHINYQLKNYLNSLKNGEYNTIELDIPFWGTVIAKSKDQIEFAVAQILSEEAGGI